MDAIVDKARDVVEGQIDFEGQRLAELLSNSLLTAIGIIAFLVGYITQNVTYTLWTGLGGTAVTFVLIVPPWPFYNKHPVAWLPSRRGRAPAPTGTRHASAAQYGNITVDGKKVS